MNTVTLQKQHIRILKNKSIKDEFITAIISILQDEEPQASCSFMEDVFYDLVNYQKPKIIPGIPQFDPTGMKNNELVRYKQVQAGKVPSNGLNRSYKSLKFKAITTLEKKYLNKLYGDCLSRINKQNGSIEYRRFINYLAQVIKHCADSGEL